MKFKKILLISIRIIQPPVPAEKWEGIRDATIEGNACIQSGVKGSKGSEDCLYLNVYTPEVKNFNFLCQYKNIFKNLIYISAMINFFLNKLLIIRNQFLKWYKNFYLGG